jgi:hypothetical protein
MAKANIDNGEGSSSRSSSENLKETVEESRFDAPGHHLRRLNRTILIIKLLLAGVLLAAAGACAGLVYRFVGNSQRASFRSDFSLIANYITEALLDDTASFFEIGQSTAIALTLIMKANNATQLDFAIPVPEYRILTDKATKLVHYTTWNPLLRNDEERRQFEEMVDKRESEGFFDQEVNPVCNVCGDESLSPSTPDVIVVLSGIGEYSCYLLYDAGLGGLVNAGVCPFVTEQIIEKCSCAPKDSSAIDTSSDRKPSEGLYQITANKTIVDEPWTGGPYLPMWLDSSVVGFRNALLFDHMSHAKSLTTVSSMLQTGYAQVSEMFDNSEPSFYSLFHLRLLDPTLGPQSVIYYPVQSPTGTDVIGAVSLPMNWFTLLRNPVPSKGVFVTIVIENSCGQAHTYRVKDDGFNLVWIGEGDHHERHYDHMMHRTTYELFDSIRSSNAQRPPQTPKEAELNHCDYVRTFIVEVSPPADVLSDSLGCFLEAFRCVSYRIP